MPIRRAFRFLLLGIFVAALGPRSGSAAVLIHLTVEEMTGQSSAILLGRCVEVRSVWNADHSDIVTHNVFEVREYYKGNLGPRVTLTELGGQVGEWVSEYSGVPRFQAGEEAVLFVWTDPRRQHQVIGLTQGKFRVARDRRSGEVVLQQSPSGEPMLEPPAHPHGEPAGPLVVPLGVLKDRVQLLLKQPSGGARQ